MRIIKSPKRMKEISKAAHKKNKTVGFVPTMGYLHRGHLSLIKKARRECNLVVVSIYVNPLQFGSKEDYKKYPRNLLRDKKLTRGEKVDFLFTPNNEEMYPCNFQTSVCVEKLSNNLCGTSRPGHFEGVCMIVSKLFNVVEPDIAYFGQKDFQQAKIIEQMVKDLNMDIKLKILPIVREEDGLALSSRNKYMSPKERKIAPILYESLLEAKKLIRKGLRDSKEIKEVMKRMIKNKKDLRIDYIEIVDADTLQSIKRVNDKALIALAFWLGKVRLIDNILIKH